MSKKPEGKYDPTLVPQSFIEMLSRVREYGIAKHGNRDDWHTTHPNEHFKSAMRHLLAAVAGEEFDESGFPHIAMAACNLMFEVTRKNYKFSHKVEVDAEQQRYDGQGDLFADSVRTEMEYRKRLAELAKTGNLKDTLAMNGGYLETTKVNQLTEEEHKTLFGDTVKVRQKLKDNVSEKEIK